MAKRIKRELKFDIFRVVLCLVQMRDKNMSFSFGNRFQLIQSIKSKGSELKRDAKLLSLNIAELTDREASLLCTSIGYIVPSPRCKTDLTINGKNYAIRCLNYTDRALVNHKVRTKYLNVCDILQMDITPFDKMIDEYWLLRECGIINEDIINSNELSPFARHMDYLKPILSHMAFCGCEERNSESADYILDYIDPSDYHSWKVYSEENYIDTIWNYLRFSFRADRGMPVAYEYNNPLWSEVTRWTHYILGQYKGALHIRVVAFDSSKSRVPNFLVRHKEQLEKMKANRGERDEIMIKIFLLESKMKGLPVPLDDGAVMIKTVGGKNYDFFDLPFRASWSELSDPIILYITDVCKISKAPALSKADVYVNNIGISLKSYCGKEPSLINQTTRSKILWVMEQINSPIIPLDNMVNNYWNLRLSKIITEDIKNSNLKCPFLKDKETDIDGKIYLKPLLNFFAFKGTGTRYSEEPADYVLEFYDPYDRSKWHIYSEENYIDAIWPRLRFSLRNKGMSSPSSTHYMKDKPWARIIDDNEIGSFNVRIEK